MTSAQINGSHAVGQVGRRVTSGPAWIAAQTLLVTSAVVVYFGARGITNQDPDRAVDHGYDLLALEQRLGLDGEAALQDAMLRSDAVATAANWVYIYGHWPVIVATLFWLAMRHRERYVLLRDAMLTSGAIGLVIFATYPVAPPRLLSAGYVDTVTERSQSYRVLQPTAFVNQYAAMPSLHAGWDLLVGLSISAVAGSVWLRWAGRALPALMVLAVVVTGNHFVVDVVAGLALALVGLAAAHARRRWREGRTAARPRPAATGPQPDRPPGAQPVRRPDRTLVRR